MSFELVYTSARRGLRSGASGFCTVAATKGIPRSLQSKLESMSGYQQAEARIGQTPPVNFAHTTIRVQGTIYHVVSRIGHAGKDYTGRSNKIAHHLALTPSEASRMAENPSELLADEDFWFAEWDSDPQTLDAERQPVPNGLSSNRFETWESVYGDPGWAGLMAQGIDNGFKSTCVIVPESALAVDLLSECFALVKPEKRWKVCFSTHYSRQISGDQCHWRFVLDQTSEAGKIRNRSQGTLIDFRNQRTELSDENDYVQAARNGTPESVHSKSSSEDRRRISIAQAQVDDGEERELRPSQRRRRERAAKQKMADVQTRSPFDISEDEYSHIRLSDDDDDQPRQKKKRRRRRKLSPAVMLVLGLAAALVALLAFLGISQL